MKNKNAVIGAAIVLTALTGLGKARGIPPAAPPPAELRYTTSCTVVDSNTLDGYVSNLSTETYRVLGETRFKFYAAGSISRPEILIPTDAVVKPGATALVSHAQLAFTPGADETCRFDVTGLIQKQ